MLRKLTLVLVLPLILSSCAGVGVSLPKEAVQIGEKVLPCGIPPFAITHLIYARDYDTTGDQDPDLRVFGNYSPSAEVPYGKPFIIVDWRSNPEGEVWLVADQRKLTDEELQQISPCDFPDVTPTT